MKIDLCLEGGGIRGIAHVGALKALEVEGFEPAYVIGTSAGSMVAALIAAGYNADELWSILIQKNFSDLLDAQPGTRVWNLIHNNGLYLGDKAEAWVEELLAAKEVKTFGDLKVDNEDEQYRYKLRIITTDITNQRLTIWPDDAYLYGLDPDSLSVAWAVRTSISIPFVYYPAMLELPAETIAFIDGGVVSNYPIWFYDAPVPTHPTFGILLQGHQKSRSVSGLFSYAGAILNTVISARDKERMFNDDCKYRSIVVPTGEQIGTLDFNLSRDQKQNLWYAGVNAVKTFLASWTWEGYQQWVQKTRVLSKY